MSIFAYFLISSGHITKLTQNSGHKANEDGILRSFDQGDDFAYSTYTTPNRQNHFLSILIRHKNKKQTFIRGRVILQKLVIELKWRRNWEQLWMGLWLGIGIEREEILTYYYYYPYYYVTFYWPFRHKSASMKKIRSLMICCSLLQIFSDPH